MTETMARMTKTQAKPTMILALIFKEASRADMMSSVF
jgi:hypothetical protein